MHEYHFCSVLVTRTSFSSLAVPSLLSLHDVQGKSEPLAREDLDEAHVVIALCDDAPALLSAAALQWGCSFFQSCMRPQFSAAAVCFCVCVCICVYACMCMCVCMCVRVLSRPRAFACVSVCWLSQCSTRAKMRASFNESTRTCYACAQECTGGDELRNRTTCASVAYTSSELPAMSAWRWAGSSAAADKVVEEAELLCRDVLVPLLREMRHRRGQV